MILGYGICGPNEAGRYMEATLKEFVRLCDDAIILMNNAGQAEKQLVEDYGFKWVEDNREWGKNQNIIKQEFLEKHVSKLKPDWCVCLDMDEVFEPSFTKPELEKLTKEGWAFHFYIVNLWNDGWKSRRSFWNVRMFKWTGDCLFENKPLHPGLAPKWAYLINQHAPFILRHYGLKEKSDRMKKVERYEKYDPNHKYCSTEYYKDLLSDTSEPYDEADVHKEVARQVALYKPIKAKKPPMTVTKKYVYIRSKNGHVYDVPAEDLHLYTSQGCEVISDVKPPEVELPQVNPLKCVICGREAKTENGLKVHMKAHNREPKE